ncbi:MAG: hypothetical protein GY937_01970 [bacterium]|nr:hypothetical protein [bacterium]
MQRPAPARELPLASLLLLCLLPGLSGCLASGGTRAVRPHPVKAARAPEQRIETLVHTWFALLEVRASGETAFESHLADPPFEIDLVGGTIRTPEDLHAWHAHLLQEHPEREYRIDPVRIVSAGDHLYRAHFRFDRHTRDGGGSPHVARREHTWFLRMLPSDEPVILRIEERPLLAFPGTGPQITCY